MLGCLPHRSRMKYTLQESSKCLMKFTYAPHILFSIWPVNHITKMHTWHWAGAHNIRQRFSASFCHGLTMFGCWIGACTLTSLCNFSLAWGFTNEALLITCTLSPGFSLLPGKDGFFSEDFSQGTKHRCKPLLHSAVQCPPPRHHKLPQTLPSQAA